MIGSARTEEVITKPPVKNLGADTWRISGIYEHQVLKAGLRQLDDTWSVDGLLQLPRAKDGGSILMRESLFRDMLEGTIQLQSVPANDVAAAQRDVPRLTLRQLLRLRVLHLDFTPSGSGADSGVTGVGGTHEAFLTILDSSLFHRLGESATSALGDDGLLDSHHRLGRQVVFLIAAAAAVPAPTWWCWWLTEKRRVFFNADQFVCACHFPEGDDGVLEVTDMSKADRNDPTGGLRWFDWRVNVVRAEVDLSATPLSSSASGAVPGTAATATAVSSTIATTATAASSAPETGGFVSASSASEAGSRPGGFASADMLKGIRNNLRKVETNT